MKSLLLCVFGLVVLQAVFPIDGHNIVQDFGDNTHEVEQISLTNFPQSDDDEMNGKPNDLESKTIPSAEFDDKPDANGQLENIFDELKEKRQQNEGVNAENHKCSLPLGMEDGRIPDNAMTASSYAALPGYRASRARLNTVSIGSKGYGAWAAAKNDNKQWLKIDLGEIARVARVVTQGRQDANQWLTHYSLSYSFDDVHWADFKINSNVKVFSANTDRNTIVGHNLVPYIETRFIRFNVRTWLGHVVMRAELYGCRTVHSCSVPVGIEDGRIPDSAMTASSSLSSAFPPKEARLNKQRQCWIPKTQKAGEYLQIDFGKEYSVTKVATQGRYNVAHWVKTYTLKSSIDGSHWVDYKVNSATKVFSGNTDGNSPITHILNPRMEARFIRFYPRSWQSYLAMRVEVYGCPSKPNCYFPLGLEDGRIPNPAMTGTGTTPSSGRLNGPKSFIASKNNAHQYLMVDFVSVVKVTGIATQGRPTHNQYVKNYRVSYSIDGAHWAYIRRNSQIKVFSGNNDQQTIIRNNFHPALYTRYIKLHPTAWQAHISFRMEVYGCHAGDSCFAPLGFEDGRLADQFFTASSFYNANYKPQYGRLNNVIQGSNKGSWLAKANNLNQWLQADLGRVSVITKMAIQGRYEGAQYVQSYTVSYSQDGVHWSDYRLSSGNPKVFGGNADQQSIRFNRFEPAINAKFVRVHPKTWQSHIGMRMELYGCYLVNNCMMPLGVEDGRIHDGAMTASTEADQKHAAKFARLNLVKTNKNIGGWCTKKNDANQWIQIDFPQTIAITKIAIQGRQDSANWVKSFKLDFSYNEQHWAQYKHESVPVVFAGSFDQHSIQVHRLHPAIYARFLRLRPVTWRSHICMRMEVYGCVVNAIGNMAVTTY